MVSISMGQIRYVLALAKTGSFSKAAKQCFVTQSTLSTMIKKLEDQIDLRLFDRKSKPIKLTKEGLYLIDQLRRIDQEYKNLDELIQDTKEEFYGTLKIGIIPTVAPFLVPLFLDKMVGNLPDVHFSIDEIPTKEIMTRIRSRDLDLGLLSLPAKDKEFNQKALYLEEFLIYDAGNQDLPKKKYKIKDIDTNRLWLLEESHCLTDQIEKICLLRKNRKISNNLVYNSGSILSLLQMVNINKGITLLPRLATLQKSLIDQRYLHEMASPIPVRQIGLISHHNFAKKRLLNMVAKVIKDATKPLLPKPKKIEIIRPF